MTEELSEFKEIEAKLLSLLKESGLSIKQFKVISAKAEQLVKEHHINSPDYAPKEYWGLEIAAFAYGVVLETGCSANEAMKFAAEWFSKPEGWVELTKNNPFFYAKQVVNRMKDHPRQKRMVKNKTIDLAHIKRSDTVNQQLRRLRYYRTLDERINVLEDQVSATQKEVELLKVADEEKQSDIDILFQNAGLLKLSPQEKAKHLLSRGFAKKVIAERLGVSERTLRRWIN